MTDEKYELIKQHLQDMDAFNEESIPNVPKMKSEEDYQYYVVKNFIRCGAIPKKYLIVGKTYIGNCRNSSEAIWNGKQFSYKRSKFGMVFEDTINHFEDDDGYDLFVPIKEK